MATVQKEILIQAPPEQVWEALSDWGALHERLVPGFAVAVELDGEDRLVTFVNGAVLRERFVSLDQEQRRLVWSIADAPYVHHNGCAQVFDQGDGTTRFVWVADVLPHELAGPVGEAMQLGVETAKRTLEGARG